MWLRPVPTVLIQDDMNTAPKFLLLLTLLTSSFLLASMKPKVSFSEYQHSLLREEGLTFSRPQLPTSATVTEVAHYCFLPTIVYTAIHYRKAPVSFTL